MKSDKKLELSRETLRDLTSDLPSERLMNVRGGEGASFNTCIDCVTRILYYVEPTWLETECWGTR